MKTQRNRFKLIATILSAVVLLLLTVYGYLSLRKYYAYKDTIHADAEFIVKVDADQLYYSLAKDYLSNLSYYRSKKGSSIESGLSIPAQIFIYTVKSKSTQTYFCAMPVADTLLLRSFIKQKLGITTLKQMGQYVTGRSADGRLTIAFNGDTFAVGYSFNAENVNDVIADLLNKKNLLSDKDEKIAKLKALKSHLAYVFEEYTGVGDFKDGQLHMEGDFNFKDFAVKGKRFSHRVFDKDAIVKIWLNAKPSLNKSFRAIKVKDYEIYPDSLLKYYNGYFDVEMGKPVSQADTVITYEYNDDFEKEETITPRIVKVPGINSVVAGNATELLNYLSKANIISNSRVNKELFPLYNLYTRHNRAEMVLSTDQHAVTSKLTESTPYFFYLYADFDQLKSQGQFPLFERYIKQLKRLVVNAKPEADERLENNEDTGRNHFEIDLYFKRKDVNALGQLR
ncbi:hypothetical protein [Pedobacter hiemivivus]|uniref:DUF4836 family protein n=1 Tax=Pedobacter hiemivivus TaxID=2530454 RepID=A0A4R0MQ31_9SPHI|nr:hypothetical protein [Pedobacter hiemivivus]TCC88362.1 hypothetical protein EZ444_22115 [Pedobacter hiemivivus]